MKRRLLSIFMCLCVIMTFVPFSVFAADEGNVTNGYYDETGAWQKGGDGTKSYTANDGTKLTLSKTAEDKGNDNFEITLQVIAERTKELTPPGAAATVLVIDVSGSMKWCANCGTDTSRHAKDCDKNTRQSRMDAAKTAAKDFLNSYKGDAAGSGRYVSIVKFSTDASVSQDWIDVSTTEGYNAAVSVIDSLSAEGGTNLEQGLYKANAQFSKDAVKSIEKAQHYVVALTDGAPTFYGNPVKGDGGSGSKTTNSETAKTAATLRGNSSVYTVCFGVANEYTWEEFFGLFKGPKVGEFLRDSIATPADGDKTYAYNASNVTELNTAFAEISKSISSDIGSSGAGASVSDPMGNFVSTVKVPENFVCGDSAYNWTLGEVTAQESTSGGVTTYTYTYTLKYTVTLDTDAEGFDETVFHPANKPTVLNWAENESYEFPVPGLKGETSRYTVTYLKGDHGILNDEDDSVIYENIKKWSDTVTADRPTPEVTADDGYYFIGWEPVIADKVTGDAVYTAQYAAQTEVVITGDSKTVDYNGSEQSITTYQVAGVDAAALSGISYIAKGTDAGNYEGKFSGTPVITIDGKDVTGQYKFTYKTGALVVNKLDVTLTSGTDSKTYDGNPLTKEEVIVGGDGFVKGEGASYSEFASIIDKGSIDNTFKYTFNENTKPENYDVTVIYGKLTIAPVGEVIVTITENSGEFTYDGNEKTVEGYVVKSISSDLYTEADFVFNGSAVVKGTIAGTYDMEVVPENFENVNENFKDVKFVVEDGQLVIKPLEDVVVTVKENSGEFTYDGNEKTVEGYVVESISSDLYTEDDFTFGGSAVVKGTIAGTYDMEVVPENFKNVNNNFKDVKFVVEDGQLVIKPIEKAIVIKANDASKVYDGTALTDAGFSYTQGILADGDVLSAVVEGSQLDAGSGENVVTSYKVMHGDVDVTNCYTFGDSVNGLLQVSKRPVTLTSGTDSKTYDGKPLTKEEVTVGGDGFVKGEGASYSEFASIIDKGSIDNTFKYTFNENTKPENYDVTVIYGKLTIAPVGKVIVTITENSGEYTYDGTEKTVEGYTVSSSDPLYTEADFAFNGNAVVKGTVAGTYDMDLVPENFSNTNENFGEVLFVIVDGQLVINPIAAEITITTNSAQKVYDGTALTDAGYSYTENVLVKGDVLTVDVVGSQTNAGSTANAVASYKVMRGDVDVTDCYTFAKCSEGTLTVTPKAVVITSGSASKEYDGKELTCDKVTAEGFVDGEGAEYKVTGSQTEVGSSKNTFEYTLNENTLAENYSITIVEGSLTVTPEKAPKTGDITNNALWAWLMAGSAVGIIGITALRKKEDEEA